MTKTISEKAALIFRCLSDDERAAIGAIDNRRAVEGLIRRLWSHIAGPDVERVAYALRFRCGGLR